VSGNGSCGFFAVRICEEASDVMAEHGPSIRLVVARVRRPFRDRRRELAIAAVASMLATSSAIGLSFLHVPSPERGATALVAAELRPPIAGASDRARVDELRARLASANGLVARLEAARTRGVDVLRLVDAIVLRLPNGTRLCGLTFGDETITISGSADSSTAVTSFVAELRDMSGELGDVACSTDRVIGRTSSPRGVERVIHAFDIRARYVRGGDTARFAATSEANTGDMSARALAESCADAERRIVSVLEPLPEDSEPETIVAELRRLAGREGVRVEQFSAVPALENTSPISGEYARRALRAHSFEGRVLASFGAFRRFLGEVVRAAPAVAIDSLALSSTETKTRFPLDGRLRITIYHKGNSEWRNTTAEDVR
jgi:hypothetical protein